jgi:hypothetical protein
VIRDLQHRFEIDGQTYSVLVTARPVEKSAPVLASNNYDVIEFVCSPEEVADFECDEPQKIAQRITSQSLGFLPAMPSDTDIELFSQAVFEWVCANRALAARREQRAS